MIAGERDKKEPSQIGPDLGPQALQHRLANLLVTEGAMREEECCSACGPAI